jgi:hypothetical protein
VLFTRETLSGAGASLGTPTGLETNLIDERSTNAFAQLDWTRELRKGMKLESGYKGTFRRRRTTSTSPPAPRAARSPRTSAAATRSPTTSSVNAAYAVLSQNRGKVDLQGGLRLEQAETRSTCARRTRATTTTTRAPSRARSSRTTSRRSAS